MKAVESLGDIAELLFSDIHLQPTWLLQQWFKNKSELMFSKFKRNSAWLDLAPEEVIGNVLLLMDALFKNCCFTPSHNSLVKSNLKPN